MWGMMDSFTLKGGPDPNPSPPEPPIPLNAPLRSRGEWRGPPWTPRQGGGGEGGWVEAPARGERRMGMDARNESRQRHEARVDQTERNRANRAKAKARKEAGKFNGEWTRIGGGPPWFKPLKG